MKCFIYGTLAFFAWMAILCFGGVFMGRNKCYEAGKVLKTIADWNFIDGCRMLGKDQKWYRVEITGRML